MIPKLMLHAVIGYNKVVDTKVKIYIYLFHAVFKFIIKQHAAIKQFDT